VSRVAPDAYGGRPPHRDRFPSQNKRNTPATTHVLCGERVERRRHMAPLHKLRLFRSVYRARTDAIERNERKEWRREYRHMRQFFGYYSIAFATIVGFFGIFLVYIHTSDVKALQDFEENLRSELLGQSEGGNISLYGVNNRPLDGQTILVRPNEFVSADKYKPSPVWGFEFNYVVKNDSEYGSGPLHVKVFFNDPITGDIPSSNYQDHFKYEINNTPSNPDSLPGHFTTTYVSRIVTGADKALKLSNSQAMIEVFFGKGKSVKASIYFRTP
jgi:hypothetical protein